MQIGIGLSLTQPRGGGGFSPLSLFAAGEQGAWYDPSDLSTMFQDSGAATPATAPGQGTADCPVGKILDKSGRGNHATQATAASRPTLSARLNLVPLDTRLLTSANWTKIGTPTVTANVADPFGGTKAFLITATGAGDRLQQAFAKVSPALINSWWVRRSVGSGVINLLHPNTGGVTAIAVNSTWTRFSSAVTADSAGTAYCGISIATSGDAIEVYVPQVNEGSTALPTQWVDSASTYDTAGFPLYLKFDGVDDSLGNTNATVVNTDPVVMWAGSSNINPSATDNGAALFSLNATTTITSLAEGKNGGTFYVFTDGVDAAKNALVSSPPVILGPHVSYFSCVAGSTIGYRHNTIAQAVTETVPPANRTGAGGFTIGKRSDGASGFLMGNIYQMIVRSAVPTAAQLAQGETFTNSKTQAY